MPFLVDTKAARTVIHPRDAAELLLISRKLLLSPQAAWGTAQPAGGIGGGALYYGIAGSIGFTDTRAAVDMLDVIFGLALPTPANAAIPSLLGWDVLRHFELRTNWPERIVQLDRV